LHRTIGGRPADTPDHQGDLLLTADTGPVSGTAGSLADLHTRRREVAAQIAEIGFTATGTVLYVLNECGKPACACHRDPARRHGPY
ncbi:MAG TPA: DUF6788 family protein, partial [Streptosporangiaceae bacterium]|nr:DUF6788 family protein [Streptosporangiaceae bacterium]